MEVGGGGGGGEGEVGDWGRGFWFAASGQKILLSAWYISHNGEYS